MAHGFPTMIAICRFRVSRKFTWGCRPKALPKQTPRVHPQAQFEQAAILTGTVIIQGLKVEFLVLEGMALLVASCQSQEWPSLIYLSAPLGLCNPNVRFTGKKHRKDYQSPFSYLTHSHNVGYLTLLTLIDCIIQNS